MFFSTIFQPSVFHDVFDWATVSAHHRRRHRRRRRFCYIVCACRHLCYEKRTKNYCENMYGSLLFTTTLNFFPSCLRPYLFERISWVALKLHWVLVCYIAANESKDIFKMLNDAFLCVYYFFFIFLYIVLLKFPLLFTRNSFAFDEELRNEMRWMK